jgi:hypothetical protein
VQMLSLQEIFGLMVNRGSQAAMEAVTAIPENMVTQPTSIRLHPRTRAYYEAQAEALGAPSASAMMAMVLEGVMKATRPPESVSSTDAVREGIALVKERFLHLFRVHGFTPHMIADILQPHGIGLSELMDDTKLLPLLSEKVMAEQAERFAVQLDWLNAKSVSPIATSYQYLHELGKNPKGLCENLACKLKQHDNRTDLTVLFLRETNADYQAAFENDNNHGSYVGVVVRQTFKTPSGKPYHRYEPWRTVPWGYDETRLGVKVAILWLMRLARVTHYHASFEGVEVERNVLLSICDNGGLPAEALERSSPYSWLKRWDPREYVEDGLGCKEKSERSMALKYYGYFEMDKLFAPLEPYVRADVLAVPISAENAEAV